MKRRSVLLAATAGAIAATAGRARAQSWPTRSIRIIVPFAPGGGTDVLARIMQPLMQEKLGQNIVIDNRPGAGSVIGTEAVARSAPDGYTWLMVDLSFMLTPLLQPRLPYDAEKDFVPAALLTSGPVILVTHPSLPARTVAELVAAAKAQPGRLAYASGGNGASTHLAGELLKMEAGIDLTHIPYRGSGLAINDVVAGNVPILFAGITSAGPHLTSGRLNALAITGSARHPSFPNVPTFAEAGLPKVDASSYWGILGPANTPRAIVERMASVANEAVSAQQHRQRLIDLGYTVLAGGPAAYAENIRSERTKWAEVIRRANITIN
ncbi:MAG: tripartite tricarboxylate transporter substrate binding protein [Alphaproteobacteria bacterium]|nr:tripartite tricarboxylate transporter substrate binding protein [Alphaproteobacteria bacterium]